MGLINLAKDAVQRQLARRGYRLTRIRNEDAAEHASGASYASAVDLPAGAAAELRKDNPQLTALRASYAAANLPMGVHSLWSDEGVHSQLEMAYFRGDNVYVWQLRNVRNHARLKYYLYCQYIREIDTRKLLDSLGEDGQFGCWIFDYAGLPRISRDLLDSINELYFLDRHLEIFSRQDFNVLDIGAGYGRLAHRMTQAVPGLGLYHCTDAVAESTFLCGYYLKYRGCESKTRVIPLTAVEQALPQLKLDLALNVHSFSEMRYEAIQGWFALLQKMQNRYLMIVPNDPTEFLSREADGSRRDFSDVIRDAGFRQIACEPIFRDDNVRELVGVQDHMFLFERA
jgi:hypothetical protein